MGLGSGAVVAITCILDTRDPKISLTSSTEDVPIFGAYFCCIITRLEDWYVAVITSIYIL